MLITRRKLGLLGSLALLPKRTWAQGFITTYAAQTQQFFDRLITPPNKQTAAAYDQLINALVSAGVWSLLDFLTVYAVPDGGVSLVNLVNANNQQSLTIASAVPKFTSLYGWSGNTFPTGTSVNTQFNQSTGVNFTQNSAMWFGWQFGTVASTEVLLGNMTNDFHNSLWPLGNGGAISAGNTGWSINGDGTIIQSPNAADGSGFWLAQRTGANACALYRNGVAFASSTNASATPPNSNLCVQSHLNTCSVVGAGAPLSSTQITKFYNALNAFFTAAGSPV